MLFVYNGTYQIGHCNKKNSYDSAEIFYKRLCLYLSLRVKLDKIFMISIRIIFFQFRVAEAMYNLDIGMSSGFFHFVWARDIVSGSLAGG